MDLARLPDRFTRSFVTLCGFNAKATASTHAINATSNIGLLLFILRANDLGDGLCDAGRFLYARVRLVLSKGQNDQPADRIVSAVMSAKLLYAHGQEILDWLGMN